MPKSGKVIIRPTKPAIGHQARDSHHVHAHKSSKRTNTRQRRNDRAIREG